MRIRAADAEGTDACAARGAAMRPRARFGVDEKRALSELERGIRRLAVQTRGQNLVAKRERGFDQAADAGCGVHVADAAFHRAERAELLCIRRGAEDAGESRDLDGIAEWRGGAVGFDVGNRVGGDARIGVRLRDDFAVPFIARRGEAQLFRAVVVDRLAADDGVNLITVGNRVRQSLEHDDARAIRKHGSVGIRIERRAAAIGGCHPAVL